MISILTAAISLIVSNLASVAGVVILLVFIIGMVFLIKHMIMYREWYYLFLIFLWIVVMLECLISAQAITDGVVWIFNWIRSKL